MIDDAQDTAAETTNLPTSAAATTGTLTPTGVLATLALPNRHERRKQAAIARKSAGQERTRRNERQPGR